MLGASVVAALRRLIEKWSGIETAAKSAEDEMAAAKRGVEEAVARLEEAGGDTESGTKQGWYCLIADSARCDPAG